MAISDSLPIIFISGGTIILLLTQILERSRNAERAALLFGLMNITHGLAIIGEEDIFILEVVAVLFLASSVFFAAKQRFTLEEEERDSR